MSWSQLYHELKDKHENGLNSGLKPKKLKVSDIIVYEELFQHRQTQEELCKFEAHVQDLSQAIKNTGKPLDPILVFAIGNDFVCLDGHHRIKAYEVAGVTKPVPVRVFQGGFREAFGVSIAANSKNKLPMKTEERMEAAWRMLLIGDYSRKQIMQTTKVGNGQYYRMKNGMEALERKGEAPHNMTWEEARGTLNGEWTPPTEDELEKMYAEDARKLIKALGPRIGKDPERMAEILIRIGNGDYAGEVRRFLPISEEWDEDDLDF